MNGSNRSEQPSESLRELPLYKMEDLEKPYHDGQHDFFPDSSDVSSIWNIVFIFVTIIRNDDIRDQNGKDEKVVKSNKGPTIPGKVPAIAKYIHAPEDSVAEQEYELVVNQLQSDKYVQVEASSSDVEEGNVSLDGGNSLDLLHLRTPNVSADIEDYEVLQQSQQHDMPRMQLPEQ